MTINRALYLGRPVIISNNYKLCNPIDDLVTRTDFANLQETLTKIFFVKKNIEIEESKLLAKSNIFKDNFDIEIIMSKLFSIYALK